MQVVDHHQAQIIQPAALGVHVRNGEQRIVVNENVKPREDRCGVCDVDPVLLTQVARHETLVLDRRLIR